MKIWLDDIFSPPDKTGWHHVRSIDECIEYIEGVEKANKIAYDGNYEIIELIRTRDLHWALSLSEWMMWTKKRYQIKWSPEIEKI